MNPTVSTDITCSSSPGSASAAPAVFHKSCLVVSHKLFYAVNGRYCTEGGFGKYVEVIGSLFDRVYLAVPVVHGPPAGDAAALPDGVAEVIELPSFCTKHRYGILGLCHPLALGLPLARAAKRADVVHVIFPGYIQLVGLAVARWLRRRHFCSIVGDWEVEYAVSDAARPYRLLIKPLVILHRMWVKWVLRSPLVFVQGQALVDRFRKGGFRVVEDQMSTFTEADIRRPETFGPIHEYARLLFVGRLDYKKGVPTLLEALKKLRDDGQCLVLTIVGDGPDRNAFEERVAQLGLQASVTFRGHIKDHQHLWEIYRAHDVFVLPSLTEGAPKVLIEAYAQGLPVVATNVGGIPGLVSPENGILVAPGDPDALAKGIRRIVCDDAYRRRLAEHNLRDAHDKTMEAQVRHMSAHLCQAMPELADG